jgi:hypothetical protein
MKDDGRDGSPRSEESDEGGGEVVGACIAVPKGEYELRYIDYETARFFGNPKVILHCAIIDPEDFAGLPVDRFYNVSKLIGPPGRFGNYVAPIRGDLVREYKQVIREPDRLDRISFRPLEGKRLIAELETVTTDHQRYELSKSDQYSCIKRLIRILPDENW